MEKEELHFKEGIHHKVAAKGKDLWEEMNLKPILNIALTCDDNAWAAVAEPKAPLPPWTLTGPETFLLCFYKKTPNTHNGHTETQTNRDLWICYEYCIHAHALTSTSIV